MLREVCHRIPGGFFIGFSRVGQNDGSVYRVMKMLQVLRVHLENIAEFNAMVIKSKFCTSLIHKNRYKARVDILLSCTNC